MNVRASANKHDGEFDLMVTCSPYAARRLLAILAAGAESESDVDVVGPIVAAIASEFEANAMPDWIPA